MIDTPFFHYIETKPHFLLLPLFQSIFSMTVWNTIDDRYSIFFFYIETMHNLLIFARFQSIFRMTVWNTIDDRYSNVVLYIEMKPQFLIFCPFFKAFSQWQSGIISMIDTPIYWYYCGRVNGLAFYKESHL